MKNFNNCTWQSFAMRERERESVSTIMMVSALTSVLAEVRARMWQMAEMGMGLPGGKLPLEAEIHAALGG